MKCAWTFVLVSIAVTIAGSGASVAGPEEPARAAESVRLAALSGIDDDDRRALIGVWQEGRAWTDEQAERAKRRLAADPRDLSDRLRLIGWASNQASTSKEHGELILGLVERHAADPVGTSVTTFLKSSASDEATWTVVEDAWRALATTRAESAPVLANAGYFLMNRAGDDERKHQAGEALLVRAHAIGPNEWRWTSALVEKAAYRVFIEGERMTPDAAREALRLLLVFEKTKPASVALPFRLAQGDLPRAIADAALRAGDLDEAERRARTVLDAATPEALEWDYGNVVHLMHQILGAVALRRGNVADAKSHLLDSGRMPGSPQLDSFGPQFPLARDLLAQGAKAEVLEYLTLCSKFWESGQGKLAEWRKTIEAGGTPDFGLRDTPLGEPKEKPPVVNPPPYASKPDGLAGFWETVEIGTSGMGGAIELRADGTGSFATVLMANTRWSLEGDSMTIFLEADKPATGLLGKIEGDTWTTAASDIDKDLIRYRVGQRRQGAPPILGVWSSIHDTGGTAYERYDASGWMSFRLRLAGTIEGKWSSKDGKLTLAFKGQPKQEMSTTIRDDRLLLTDAEGDVIEYRYAGPSAWYPLPGWK